MENAFFEVQRYRKWWMIALVACILILPVISIYQQIYLGKPFGNHPAPDGVLIGFSIFMFLIAYMFLRVYLKTEVGWDGITFHFSPFFKKQILWNQIKSAEIVDYGFLGGWGFRYSRKYGTVYNVSGRVGVAIELVNGQKFVIGTQKPNTLKPLLDQYLLTPEPTWVKPKT
ncbi:MAG: hypothetical protein ACI9JN_002445 [Bacteroidia bacterium]|jgi:hypothetical protein